MASDTGFTEPSEPIQPTGQPTGASLPEDPAEPVRDKLRVISRHGNSEFETAVKAAAVAVLGEVLAEEAQARRDTDDAPDAWHTSIRSMPVHSGSGNWRSFAG